jgi:A/G-specific adenine glycosylase
MNFQSEIIGWYQTSKRDLPWRNTTDAYVIWLSEVILQQTRVEQGLPYFYKFLENYPTVVDFSEASETQILKLWQGLGYYSRGRNMLHTAREVVQLYQGVFPVKYETLIKLKGIGEYTAAAISSFSSNENKAVLDGNVFRVLARFFGIDTPINSTAGKKQFSELATLLVEEQEASVYNQAIMEFGALLCKPKLPLCMSCPVKLSCKAYQNNQVNSLPVKIKKTAKKIRYFNYFICANEEGILLNHRSPGDIWQQLYDFPLLETEEDAFFSSEKIGTYTKNIFGEKVVIMSNTGTKHVLTHQIIYVNFFVLDNYIINFNCITSNKWVSWLELDHLPLPKVIADYLHSFLTK